MSRSSKRWIREHERDPYVRQAREEKYRSRSAYKLLQIQQRFRVIRPGDRVLDLGAAPGGWSQVSASIVGKSGRVVAADLLSFDPIPGVTILQCDLLDSGGVERLCAVYSGQKADRVLSDMAPSTCGIPSLDHDKIIALAEGVVDILPEVLRCGGSFVVKIFQGGDFPLFLKRMREIFQKCHVAKPPASRSRSVEIYMVAENYCPE